ncbi:pseudouridine synthase [Thalassotalea aquiviva]|uniref:pseudouridine synthase n=1 Tax=Thalassotalea aquiviva TaxID=3242415 RepID=UPI00352ADAB2
MQRTRLDKFISQKLAISRRDVRLMLAQKRVLVDGQVAENIGQIVDKFSYIRFDDKILSQQCAYYLMLSKPKGVVCATKDDEHTTVIDLLDNTQFPFKSHLHIVGRLDKNTTGLVLLTNNSEWAESITQPEHKIDKHYLVTVQNPLDEHYIDAFANGMYFGYENITTLPAKMLITSTYQAQVWLKEGKYHQIKRMFGRFQNPVIQLHRQAIGDLSLDNNLAVGEARHLTQAEVNLFGSSNQP